ncbi:MAG: NADH-quinone oxidoreductase subunit D [Candidatus Bipolaricaulota bacterium]|nr:NADH-quinone oxidoreductase subunit D [Candidatus Bipolaricaulota bacterium]MDW8031054.1 NADH-quinone oxidoreductase subunit D [Candidatus Bipolaricaulota bacterium]
MTEPYTVEAQSKDLLVLNMGPQHPSTHGVLRLILKIDGEIVREVQPVIGYLHRGMEKLAELGRYPHFIIECNRADYVASYAYEAAYVRAVEELAGLQAPPRAQYIRVICLELDRIQSHLVWLGTFGLDLGALNAFWYGFRERELILSLQQELTGVRMHPNYFRFGGVKADLPEGWTAKVRRACDEIERKLDEYEEFLAQSDTFVMRTRGVGVLTKEMAIDWGVTGPNARASGVDFDLRRDEPYFAYEEFEFTIPVRTEGDCYARFEVRLEEMRQSVQIIRQALARLPHGPILQKGWEKGYQFLMAPTGEHYTRIEGPRGEVGIYLIGDGTTFPYRVKMRSPCFQNLSVLPELMRNTLIADLVAINGSFDLVMGCVDR